MSVADKLISLGTQIEAARTHCNEALAAKGGAEASTLWEVGDRIGEIATHKDAVRNLIERDVVELEIPSGTTRIGDYAFYNCDRLVSITIPNSVRDIAQYAFTDCAFLANVTLSDNLKTIEINAFQNCYALTRIVIPDSVTDININAFTNCNALTRVVMSRNLSFIRYSTFSSCRSLTDLILPKTNSIVPLSNSNALNGTPIASGTGYIYVPQGLLSSYQSATNWSTYSAQFRAIEDYPDIVGG